MVALPPSDQPRHATSDPVASPVEPVDRFVVWLSVAAVVTAFTAGGVIALVSTPLGLLLLAMAVSWAAIVLIVVKLLDWPR